MTKKQRNKRSKRLRHGTPKPKPTSIVVHENESGFMNEDEVRKYLSMR